MNAFQSRDIVQVRSGDHSGKMGQVIGVTCDLVYVRLYDEIFPYYFQADELRLMNRIERADYAVA